MSRIKLRLPEEFVFDTKLKVHIGDINYGGHLGNDAYLRLAHEARIQFLKAQGWSEKDLDGYGLIMTDAALQFLSEVFHAEEITIKIAIDEVSKLGFDLYYQFRRDDKPIAKIKTGMRFFDYDMKKISAVPESTVNKLLILGK